MADPIVGPLLLPASLGALNPLVESGQAEGFRFLARLREEYVTGINRFDHPGEVLLGVSCGGGLIAVGGLSRDPYSGMPRTGRIRHLYVLPSWRGRGVGRLLVQAIREHAGASFDQLVLRTDTRDAARFYEALGFVPEHGIEGATHRLASRGAGARSPGL